MLLPAYAQGKFAALQLFDLEKLSWTLQNPQSNMLGHIDPTFDPGLARHQGLQSHADVRNRLDADPTASARGGDPYALIAAKKKQVAAVAGTKVDSPGNRSAVRPVDRNASTAPAAQAPQAANPLLAPGVSQPAPRKGSTQAMQMPATRVGPQHLMGAGFSAAPPTSFRRR